MGNYIPRYTTPIDEELDLRQFLLNCLHYFPGVFVGALTGLLLGYVVHKIAFKSYTSSAYLEVMTSPVDSFIQPLLYNKDVDYQQVRSELTAKLKTYETIAMTPTVIERTLKKTREKGCKDPVDLDAFMVPSTSLIQLKVLSKEKEFTKLAADTWADVVLESINSQTTDIYLKSNVLLSDPYQKITQEIASLEFRINSLKPEMDLKDSELTATKALLMGQVQELSRMDPQIEEMKLTLPILQSEIKKVEMVQPQLPANGGSNIILSDASKRSTRQDPVNVVAYGINPNYADLEKKIVDQSLALEINMPRREQLKESIPLLNAKFKALQDYMNRVTPEVDRLQRNLMIAKQRYNVMTGKIGETQLASLLPTSNLRIVSYGGNPSLQSHLFHLLSGGFFFGGFFTFLVLFLYKPVSIKAVKPQKNSKPLSQPTEMISS